MKLKCVDGVVRNFRIPVIGLRGFYLDAKCLECQEMFGVHDPDILKPEFKKHTCNIGGNKNER